jgi:hypothetical protein
MAGWMMGLERIVRLGGAGTSMATLTPGIPVQFAQIDAYALVAIAAGAAAVHHLAGGRGGRWPALVAGLGAMATLGWLAVTDQPLLERHPAPLACLERSGQRYCAPHPYARAMRPVVEQLAPTVERIRSIGAAVPTEIRLGNAVELFDGPLRPEIRFTELEPLLGVDHCPNGRAPVEAMYLLQWLALATGTSAETLGLDLDPDTPPALRSSDPGVRDEWAEGALSAVRARCA